MKTVHIIGVDTRVHLGAKSHHALNYIHLLSYRMEKNVNNLIINVFS